MRTDPPKNVVILRGASKEDLEQAARRLAEVSSRTVEQARTAIQEAIEQIAITAKPTVNRFQILARDMADLSTYSDELVRKANADDNVQNKGNFRRQFCGVGKHLNRRENRR